MIFFTADTHLGAHSILEWGRKEFRTIEEHDEHLLENINKKIGVGDKLYVLGDFCWRTPQRYIDAINCKNLHLIQGNHDKASVGKLFKSVTDVDELKVDNQKYFLSHYPHAYWPSCHRGSIHLYGHTHAQKEFSLNNIWPNRRSMDIGVDNARLMLNEYSPFSMSEIRAILDNKIGHDPV